jgi:hypothetical protein
MKRVFSSSFQRPLRVLLAWLLAFTPLTSCSGIRTYAATPSQNIPAQRTTTLKVQFRADSVWVPVHRISWADSIITMQMSPSSAPIMVHQRTVRAVRVANHDQAFAGALGMMVVGALVGFAIGAIIGEARYGDGGNSSSDDEPSGFEGIQVFFSSLFGGLLGSMTGFVYPIADGANDTYFFDRSDCGGCITRAERFEQMSPKRATAEEQEPDVPYLLDRLKAKRIAARRDSIAEIRLVFLHNQKIAALRVATGEPDAGSWTFPGVAKPAKKKDLQRSVSKAVADFDQTMIDGVHVLAPVPAGDASSPLPVYIQPVVVRLKNTNLRLPAAYDSVQWITPKPLQPLNWTKSGGAVAKALAGE